MSGLILPFNFIMDLPGSFLSRDPKVVKGYDEDPLVHWERLVRWGTEFLQQIGWIEDRILFDATLICRVGFTPKKSVLGED